MVRVLLTIIAGCLLGAGLVYGVGKLGPIGHPDIRRAQELLAQEGYWQAEVADRWSPQHLVALNAYESDWGLPVTQEIGWTEPLPKVLMARLQRSHPATRPQWARTPNGCRVWNAQPLPKESATWDGACEAGVASGKGTLVWRSVYNGKWNEDRYSGALERGKTHGQGVLISAVGDRYEGRFKDNMFHGQGTYVEASGGVYHGLFSEGFPDGYGKMVDWNGQVFEGRWKQGCLTTWNAKAYFLRTGEECGIRPRWKFKDLFN